MADKKNDKDIITYSLITLGNSGVGKTSILKRLVHNKFEENTLSTIGFGISNKLVTSKNGSKFNLKLIDTAGQENYRAMGKTYFKNSDCALFVFSLNDRKSFEEIQTWLKTYKEFNNDIDFSKLFPALLLGNKCDLEHVVDDEEIKTFQKENKFYGYRETSAKDNIGLNLIFEEIGEMLNKVYGKRKKKHNVRLTARHKESKGCACFKADA